MSNQQPAAAPEPASTYCEVCGNREQHPIHPTGHAFSPIDVRDQRTCGPSDYRRTSEAASDGAKGADEIGRIGFELRILDDGHLRQQFRALPDGEWKNVVGLTEQLLLADAAERRAVAAEDRLSTVTDAYRRWILDESGDDSDTRFIADVDGALNP